MSIIPATKYVKDGYTAKRTRNLDQKEQFIEEMVASTEDDAKYVKYLGPITITDHLGELIPLPSENKGRYADMEQSSEQLKLSQKAKEETVNQYNISGRNRDGIIRRGSHIRYLRKNPRNFVKGGFIRHINSTYIAFRYAKGSSTIQLADVEALYVSNMAGRGRQKKDKEEEPAGFRINLFGGAPRKKITIKRKIPLTTKSDLPDPHLPPLEGINMKSGPILLATEEVLQNAPSVTTTLAETDKLANNDLYKNMPYMPKKVSSWHSEVDKQRKKLGVKTKPDATTLICNTKISQNSSR